MPRPPSEPRLPTLLFDDQCGVCRRLARWVHEAARDQAGQVSVVEQPIGNDPDALAALAPGLDIWDAYATIHLIMPDGTTRLGGEAVAEVLRRLPRTRWLARCLSVTLFGRRPFQAILNLAYTILADVRPLFGCESCGTPRVWVRAIRRVVGGFRAVFGKSPHAMPAPHFSPHLVRVTPGA